MMDWIRRLLGGSNQKAASAGSTLLQTFTIEFPNGEMPLAVRAVNGTHPEAAIDALKLAQPVPTIFISGGAGLMDRESMNITRSTVEDGLARFLNEQQVSLIDGGTTSGVMGLMGLARHQRGYTFPLIGVAPEAVVYYPGHENPDKIADLDAYHSHFVLTGGAEFGTESEMIINLAHALSGEGARKSLGVIINGGDIVRKEAHRVTTQSPRIPLLILEGSGRFADELAAAYRAGKSDDPVIRDILLAGTLHVVPINEGAESLRAWLTRYFAN